MADIRERLVIEAVVEGNAVQQMNKLERETLDYARKASKGLGRVTKAMRGVGKATAFVRKAIAGLTPGLRTLLVGAVGVSALTSSAKAAQEYGLALAELGTIAGLSSDQLDLLSQASDDIARAFGISDIDVLRAQYEAVSAGALAGAESTELLGDAATLAIAGVSDLSTSVGVLTSIVNAYGLELNQASEISDILFKTVEKGVTTIPELATAMGDIIPFAAALGFEIEDVFAAVATLTKAAGKGSTSKIGTQLKALFKDLVNEASPAAVKLEQFGVSIREFRKNAEDAGDLPGFLEAVSKLEEAQIAEIFGGSEGFTAVLQLTGELKKAFGETQVAFESFAGSSRRALQVFLDSAAFTAQRSTNTIKIALRSIGEDLIVGFNEGIERAGGAEVVGEQISGLGQIVAAGATELIKFLGDLLGESQRFIDSAGGIEKITEAFRAFFALIGSTARLTLALISELSLAIANGVGSIAGLLDDALGFTDALGAIPGGGLVTDLFGDEESFQRISSALGDFVDSISRFGIALGALGESSDDNNESTERAIALEELRAQKIGVTTKALNDLKSKTAPGLTAGGTQAIDPFRTDAGAALFLELASEVLAFGLTAEDAIAKQREAWGNLIVRLDEVAESQLDLIRLADQVTAARLASAATEVAAGTRVAESQRNIKREVLDLTRDLLEQGVAFDDAVLAARGYARTLNNDTTNALKGAREAAFDWADAQDSTTLAVAATTEALEMTATGLGDAFFQIVTGAESAEDAIKKFVASALQELSRLASQVAFRSLIGSLFPSAGTLTNGFLGGGSPSSLNVSPNAAGGVINRTSGYSSISGGMASALISGGMSGYAHGGIVSSPHVAVVGEGRNDEAIVPLSGNRAIPVEMRGGGGDTISVSLTIQALDPSSAAEVMTSPEVMRRFGTALAREVSSRKNRTLNQALKQN